MLVVKVLARLLLATCCIALLPLPVFPAATRATASAALEVKEVPAARAAAVLQSIFPDARITVDSGTNAVLVIAPQAEIDAMREMLPAIDTKDPRAPTADVIHLTASQPQSIIDRVGHLFPNARLEAGPNDSILIVAPPADIEQIKAIVADVDVAPEEKNSTAVVEISQAHPRTVARVVAREVGGIRADVSGNSIVFIGPPDSVSRAKEMAAELDVPPAGTPYVQTYRLSFVDAGSVASLLGRTFPNVPITVDKTLNSVSVNASAAIQGRIAAGIAQLDANPGAPVQQAGSSASAAGAGGTTVEVINLRAATPGLNGTTSTSATDIATTVMESLGTQAPDLHITIEPNSTRLVVSGSPFSVNLAKQLIAQLDQAEDLVVLDTQIFEVDENDAKDLGLVAGTPGSPFLSTTISEFPPQLGPTAAPNQSPPPFFSIQPLTRTPLALTLSLYALVQKGNARILANPRITTISGRTATIRAGDNISVLTQTPGGVGVPPTSQIQTFQTGVTLDITPVINEGNFITVNLHPTVNSLSSTNSEGIPQISTRDTQTTVGMRADQTLVIGGLIEDDTTVAKTSVPILGNIPIIGGLFKSNSTSYQRNELVIAVTPHIIHPGEPSPLDASGKIIPSPAPLPTVSPSMLFPVPIVTSHAIFVPNRSGQTGTASQPSTLRGAYNAGVQATPAPAVPGKPGSRPVFTVPDASPTPLTLNTMKGPPGTYTYGAPTANIQAGPNDAVTIYYLTFSPNVVASGTQVNLNVTTSTNVTRLLLLNGNTSIANIQSTQPGYWQAAFAFSTASMSPTASQVTLTLTAIKADGTATSIQFPIGVTPCGAGPSQMPAFGAPTPAPC